MIIGSKIKELRKERNFTQKDLGELLGLSASTIQKYELEQREPTLETLSKMSEIFEVPLDTFNKKYISMSQSFKDSINRLKKAEQQADSIDNTENVIKEYPHSIKNAKRFVLKNSFSVDVDLLTDNQIEELFTSIDFAIKLKLEEFKNSKAGE
ncbi:helix-turn-helix domain protein [Clostridium sp. DL-VIII]|uniref:helix-turn-helix domain-containing protein n=1 Tax=Clostridium sp. DL-VIII TaxID=641107 RepID=UPI00023AF0DC|nr:helix-turn-helix transcriptional regulator [Clostridium sp. DL-VIII]EHI96985.1 helix-turn-helix domain protein [Clostridium sp. DL-VIII]